MAGESFSSFSPMNQKTLARWMFATWALNIASVVVILACGKPMIAIGFLTAIALIEFDGQRIMRRIDRQRAEFASWNSRFAKGGTNHLCRECKYFYGSNRVVCALHPYGYENNSCADFDSAFSVCSKKL